ncbi:hypothetical protein RI367_000809 [Sorochytrium milnesiophthora]
MRLASLFVKSSPPSAKKQTSHAAAPPPPSPPPPQQPRARQPTDPTSLQGFRDIAPVICNFLPLQCDLARLAAVHSSFYMPAKRALFRRLHLSERNLQRLMPHLQLNGRYTQVLSIDNVTMTPQIEAMLLLAFSNLREVEILWCQLPSLQWTCAFLMQNYRLVSISLYLDTPLSPAAAEAAYLAAQKAWTSTDSVMHNWASGASASSYPHRPFTRLSMQEEYDRVYQELPHMLRQHRDTCDGSDGRYMKYFQQVSIDIDSDLDGDVPSRHHHHYHTHQQHHHRTRLGNSRLIVRTIVQDRPLSPLLALARYYYLQLHRRNPLDLNQRHFTTILEALPPHISRFVIYQPSSRLPCDVLPLIPQYLPHVVDLAVASNLVDSESVQYLMSSLPYLQRLTISVNRHLSSEWVQSFYKKNDFDLGWSSSPSSHAQPAAPPASPSPPLPLAASASVSGIASSTATSPSSSASSSLASSPATSPHISHVGRKDRVLRQTTSPCQLDFFAVMDDEDTTGLPNAPSLAATGLHQQAAPNQPPSAAIQAAA